MTQVRQSYTSSDLGRMQQEAVTRVRQMQDRAHQGSGSGGAAFRNWSTNPNFRRSEQPSRRPPPPPPEPHTYTPPPQEPPIYTPPPRQEPPEAPIPEHSTRRQEQGYTEQAYSAREEAEPPPRPNRPPRPEPAPEKPKDTTLLQDILGGVGLDDDRILILGLILILINDKADTTLILALLYLLL